MKLDFLKDTAGTLLAIAVVGLVGYATQIATLGKDIERVADNLDEIKEELAKNYDQDDAARDRADIKRELEIINERIANTEERINGRINILDERTSRVSNAEID